MERAYDELIATTRFYGSIRILSFPKPAVECFHRLKKQKLNIGTMDLRIAAIALHFGGTLVTRNLRDFRRVPGLPVEDWTQTR